MLVYVTDCTVNPTDSPLASVPLPPLAYPAQNGASATLMVFGSPVTANEIQYDVIISASVWLFADEKSVVAEFKKSLVAP